MYEYLVLRDIVLSPQAAESNDAPRLNRRQAAKVRTRQKVMEAARSLFAQRGYDPATIRDIAKGAGMSTGAVFANFQDKAELFEAVLAEDLSRLTETMKAASDRDGAVRERLLYLLTAGYHASLDHLPLVQAVVARSWFQPQSAEKRARAAVQPLAALVDDALHRGVTAGQLRQDADLALIAELVWTAFASNYRRAAYDNWDEARLADHLGRQLDLILDGALVR